MQTFDREALHRKNLPELPLVNANPISHEEEFEISSKPSSSTSTMLYSLLLNSAKVALNYFVSVKYF